MKVSKKIAAVVLAAGTVVGGTVAITPAAQAQTEVTARQTVPDYAECSRNEYRRVYRGMSKERVARIIGTNGHSYYRGGGYDYREYGGKKVGSLFDQVTWAAECYITFNHGRVSSKDGWYGRI